MPSINSVFIFAALVLDSFTSALPALSERSMNHIQLVRRQNAAAQAAGLTDVDIAQLYVSDLEGKPHSTANSLIAAHLL